MLRAFDKLCLRAGAYSNGQEVRHHRGPRVRAAGETIEQFADFEGISLSTYFKLKRLKLNPHELAIPGPGSSASSNPTPHGVGA